MDKEIKVEKTFVYLKLSPELAAIIDEESKDFRDYYTAAMNGELKHKHLTDEELVLRDLAIVGGELEEARNGLLGAQHRARQEAVKAAECGISEHEIARRLGVSRTTVRKWLDK